MRVLAFAPYPEEAPSTRFRLAQFQGHLLEGGVRLEILPALTSHEFRGLYEAGGILAKGRLLSRVLARRRRQLRGTEGADLILIHREVSPIASRWLMREAEALGVPLVFDFDDAVFLPGKGGNPILQRLRRPRASTIRLCRSASLVLAGNEYLAEFARAGRGGGSGVEVLPTVIDTEVYRPRQGACMKGDGSGERGELPVVGWIGTHSTLPYLHAISDALAEAHRRTPFRLTVVCNREPRLGPGLDVDFRRWTLEGEAEDIRCMDVGIYPLPDDPWTRGKCGFKAIQYMASGVPVIASPVGVLTTIVQDGRTGLHAGNEAAWVEGLTRLLRGPEDRARMGEAGRERAVEEYSVAAVTPGLLAWLREVVAP